jgi:hypothetical protein
LAWALSIFSSSSFLISGSLKEGTSRCVREGRERSHLFAIRSERILLSLMTKFDVRRYLWCIGSSSFQGMVLEKNSFSLARASDQVIPFFRSIGDGCLTQNQLFSRDSSSFRINLIQRSSSPGSIRSGLVRTPERVSHQEQLKSKQ